MGVMVLLVLGLLSLTSVVITHLMGSTMGPTTSACAILMTRTVPHTCLTCQVPLSSLRTKARHLRAGSWISVSILTNIISISIRSPAGLIGNTMVMVRLWACAVE